MGPNPRQSPTARRQWTCSHWPGTRTLPPPCCQGETGGHEVDACKVRGAYRDGEQRYGAGAVLEDAQSRSPHQGAAGTRIEDDMHRSRGCAGAKSGARGQGRRQLARSDWRDACAGAAGERHRIGVARIDFKVGVCGAGRRGGLVTPPQERRFVPFPRKPRDALPGARLARCIWRFRVACVARVIWEAPIAPVGIIAMARVGLSVGVFMALVGLLAPVDVEIREAAARKGHDQEANTATAQHGPYR